MIRVIVALFVCLVIVSCQPGRPSRTVRHTENDSLRDTVAVETDSTYTAPPKAADGLFDDFIYVFMKDAAFQRQRISFPLKFVVKGKQQQVNSKEWKHDPLYLHRDVYTIITKSKKEEALEKDTLVRNVVVEWVNLSRKEVKQYHFVKNDGRWMLNLITLVGMDNHEDADFYAFYQRFAVSEAYQKKHLLNPFKFRTYDSDNFQTIDGLLDPEQWPDFRPTLPHDVITNIRYSPSHSLEAVSDSPRRTLQICSVSGGMGCSLTFVNKKGSWWLERLDN